MASADRIKDAEDITVTVGYEPPKLVVLGNLRDLLAGGGSHACDGSIGQPGHSDEGC